MKAFSPLAVLISALLLQGCVAAAVVGTAAVGTKAATDPRSVGTRWMTERWNCVSAARCRKMSKSKRDAHQCHGLSGQSFVSGAVAKQRTLRTR